MNSSTFNPNWAVAPGPMIEEYRDAANLTQQELADRLGYSFKHVNQVIGGHQALTPEMALRLESVLGLPAHVWLSIEAKYREHLARVEQERQIDAELPWLKEIPYRELVKLGYVAAADRRSAVRVLQSFFGVSSLDMLPTLRTPYLAQFRKSDSFASNPYALLAWLTQGERLANGQSTGPFDAKLLRASLPALRSLSQLPDTDFVEPLVEQLASLGVILIFVPAPKGAPVSGATRWLRPDRALVQLSLRHKSDDHLWFTLFHELGHILLHGKRERFIDFAPSSGDGDSGVGEPSAEYLAHRDKERQADNFAAETLLPAAALNAFLSAGDLSATAITDFATASGISPGIVVGRLQHQGLVPYGSALNKLKRRYRFVPTPAK